MDLNSKILVLGASGLVGSAIVRRLEHLGAKNILAPSRSELDLSNQAATLKFFYENAPEFVFAPAAKVGGIAANSRDRADFIFENLRILTNVIEASSKYEVKKLMSFGSSCIYPKDFPQPLKEEYLLQGPIEPTNEPFAVAKIAGVKMVEAFKQQYGSQFISVMPTGIYGENDNYHKEDSHVVAGLIARFKEAIDSSQDEFYIWGSGRPRRDFLYVDDLADACLFLMQLDFSLLPSYINVGPGYDISIGELAKKIADIVGYKGSLKFDSSRPDGAMKKCLDVSKLFELGWRPSVTLEEGLKKAVEFYLEEYC